MSQGSNSPDFANEITSGDIAHSFWVIPVLEHLVDSNAFLRFYKTQTSLKGEKDSYALGYSFASCLALQFFIQAFLDSPEVFGIRSDEGVERAFQSDISFLEMPTDSSQGRIIVNIAKLYRSLLGVKSFDQFNIQIEPVKIILLPILREVSESYDINISYRRVFKDMPTALHHMAVIALHLFYQDVNLVKIAFHTTFGRSKNFFAQMTQLPEVMQKQRFFEGYKLAVGYLWHSLLGAEVLKYNSIKDMLNSASWKDFDSFYRAIQSEIITPLEKVVTVDVFGLKRVFVVKEGVSADLPERLSSISAPNLKEEEPVEKQLDRTFLGYPVRIVNHGLTASCTSGFVVALSGAVSLIKGKVKVRRFVHGHTFSYALLISASSNLADYSTWWLFHDFCSNDSGMGSAGYREVEKYLKKYGNNVELREFFVESSTLRDYAENHSEMAETEMEEPGFDPRVMGAIFYQKYSPSLRKQLDRAKKDIEKMKGAILELIVATIVAQLGYKVFWSYQNSTILDDGEVDVLGFRNDPSQSELMIVECATSFDNKLISELQGKMDRIAHSIKRIAIQLHWKIESENCIVKGLIVTTDSPKDQVEKTPSNINLWYRKEFLDKCKTNGIKTEFVDQLFRERFRPEKIILSSTEDFSKFFFSPSEDE